MQSGVSIPFIFGQRDRCRAIDRHVLWLDCLAGLPLTYLIGHRFWLDPQDHLSERVFHNHGILLEGS